MPFALQDSSSVKVDSVSLPHFVGQDLVCIRGERMVFARLCFTLNAGETMFLVGPNGSGKSSLLRLLAGLLYPTAGSLFREGRLVSDGRMKSHTALVRYVGHLDATKPTLSVAETLTFWGRLFGLNRRQAEEATTFAITCFDLRCFANTPGRLLSAGQKRRVSLARLLLGISDLWLLDEPTIALDQAAIGTLVTVLAKHRANGGMVVLATHTTIDLPAAHWLDMRDFTVDPLLGATHRIAL